MKEKKAIRIGLVGLGRHLVGRLLPNILATSNLTVVAACDLDAGIRKGFEQRFPKIVTLSSAKELFDQAELLGLEAVVISLDPREHVRWTKHALELGLHVFVEKPPAFSGSELRPLMDLEKKTGLVTMVGMMWRYSPVIQLFREWQKKELGRAIRHLSLTATFPFGVSRPTWKMVGLELAFYEQFLHALDLTAALMGHPASVKVYKHRYDSHQYDQGERHSVSVILRYLTGELASLDLYVGFHRYFVDLRLALEDGSYVSITDFTQLSITTQPTWSGTPGGMHDHPSLHWEPGRFYPGYARHGYAEEFGQFSDSILRGMANPTSLEEAAQDLFTLQACLRSLREKEEIRKEEL
jgi:predicted dehydrogenase